MEVYDVYYNNVINVGVLYVDFNADKFEFELVKKDLPLEQQPYFLLDGVNSSIKDWILERAPEPNASCIDIVLQDAGLKEYDAYALFRHKEGRFIYDKISCIERRSI